MIHPRPGNLELIYLDAAAAAAATDATATAIAVVATATAGVKKTYKKKEQNMTETWPPPHLLSPDWFSQTGALLLHLLGRSHPLVIAWHPVTATVWKI